MENIDISYSWAVETCNADNVGYSQDYRAQQTVNGITYYDCSSFIWYALKAGGFDVVTANNGSNYPFTTRTMPNVLLKLGFREVQLDGEWLPGDICLGSAHTEMVYEGGIGEGICMGAHGSKYPLQDQVSIANSASQASRWNTIFRYGSGGAGKYGYSIYVVAAIAGNWWQESTINPGRWEGGTRVDFESIGHGYGLGQWTNTDESYRLLGLHDWLEIEGYALDDGNAQCEYLVVEDVWYSVEEAEQYATLTDFLESDSTDLEELVHAFCIGWEGIHDSSWDRRVQYAERAFNYIAEHANDTNITIWITGNRSLSAQDVMNNAVMLYRYFSAGGGGGGSPGTRKKGMPIYMKIRYH